MIYESDGNFVNAIYSVINILLKFRNLRGSCQIKVNDQQIVFSNYFILVA